MVENQLGKAETPHPVSPNWAPIHNTEKMEINNNNIKKVIPRNKQQQQKFNKNETKNKNTISNEELIEN